jgi:hypothetical protein
MIVNTFSWSNPLKHFFPPFFIILAIAVFVTACGYRNPYVYSGPDRTIYATTWKNRTNVLQLDSKIYQSLIKWYQKTGSLAITKTKENADYILAGEIISIDLPSLTYGGANNATEVNIRLRVRYIMKDLTTDAVLIEQPSELWTQEYKVGANATVTRDNESEALDIIIDDLSQKIYQRSLLELAKF